MKKRYLLNAFDRRRPSSIANRSQLEKVSYVYNNLDATHQTMLKASCFQQLVGLKGLNVSAQILHHLVMRMSETTDGEIFWFMIGEKAIRFSISEFVLVSGLKVGDDTKTNKRQVEAPRLVSKYLKGSIKRKCVLDAFNNCNDDQTDKYKLGLIVILSYVVMGSEENTKIQWWWFDLVDDLEKFNEYPWGNSSYKLTTNFLRRNMISTFTGKNEYSLHGFPLSILVWALEAIPSLSVLAEKVAVENVPRFLNWKLVKNLKSTNIDAALEDEHVDVEEKLEPTEDEKQQPYWVALGHFMGEDETRSQQGDARKFDYQFMKDIVRSVVEEENKKIYCVLHRIEAKVDTVLMSTRASASRGVQVNLDDVDVEQTDDEGFTLDDDKLDDCSVTKDGEEGEGCIQKDDVMIDVENRVFEEVIEVGVEGEDIDILVTPNKVDDETSCETIEVKEPRGRSKKRKAKRVVCPRVEPARPSLDPSKRRKLEGVTKYEPFRELDPAKLVHLNNWLEEDSDITTDLGDGNTVCAKVLRGVLSSGWLSANIINASLKLIRDRMECYPNLFQHDACGLDTYFSKFVSDEYAKLKGMEEKDYDGHVFSSSLMNWAKGWGACRNLYAPVCEKNHWFVIQIDLEECCIYVFDSMTNHIREAELHKFMLPIQKVVPLVLKSVVERDLGGELKVHKVKNVPGQSNGDDCGIFALKFIEFLIGGQGVLSIKAGYIPKWREKLVAELIAHHFEP